MNSILMSLGILALVYLAILVFLTLASVLVMIVAQFILVLRHAWLLRQDR